VCFAAHVLEFLDGLPYLSNFSCLPGRAGGTPFGVVVSTISEQPDIEIVGMLEDEASILETVEQSLPDVRINLTCIEYC
jgi:hypothetical protein